MWAKPWNASPKGAALVLALAGYFAAAAFATPATHYATPHAVAIALLYGLLASTLGLGAALVARAGWLGAIAGALGLAAAVVWHLREQTLVPGPPTSFAIWVLLAAGLLVAPLRKLRATPWRPLAASAALSTALLASGLLAAYHGSNTLRWHLLNHEKTLGTPLWLAIGRRVEGIASELWIRAATTPPAAALQPEIPTPSVGPGPPVVVVLIDTLRADALTPYGGASDLMPRLSALAEDAFLFTDVASNASYTRSSVASLFTGLLPEEHGAVDHRDRLPDEVTTLAEAFGARGYETAAFVANYANVNRAAGFDQGFHHFQELQPQGSAYVRAVGVGRAVSDWLDRRDESEAPLFLYLHYLDPHTPYLSGWPDPSRRHVSMRRGYDHELRYMDAPVSDLIAELERRLPGARVIVTSDHGEEFGEHGDFGHGHSLYREVLHVPAFLRGPGVPTGIVDTRLELRDLFDLLVRLSEPALLDLRGWADRNARPTRYASQYIDRVGAPFYRPADWFTCMRSLERGDRLLIWSAFGDTSELYDPEADRSERANLADREPGTVARLRDALEEHPRRWRLRVAADADDDTEEMLRALGYIQ